MIKILALITMTIDHIGIVLLHNYAPFRSIGRLAYPLFAFMLAEGCYYTRNKRRHLLGIFLLGALCQVVYFVVEGSVYQGILMTFTLSVLMIYAMEYARSSQNAKWRWIVPVGMLAVILFLCLGMPKVLAGTDYGVDYGIWGVLFPALVSVFRDRRRKWLMAAAGLILLSISMGRWQWYCLAALIPLWFYNGERGKWNTKHLFYIYYPTHLAVLYGISLSI